MRSAARSLAAPRPAAPLLAALLALAPMAAPGSFGAARALAASDAAAPSRPVADVPPPGSEPATIRAREIYVPYEEFLALVDGSGAGRDGVVMSLAEYRALVAAASLGLRDAEREELPPLASSVVEGRYAGTVAGKAVRFHATLSVRVAAEGWVRCDLGPPIPALGAILVDDAPGWVVVQDGRAQLLLKGRGAHEVELAFTAPVTETEDRSALEAPLVPAASARVEVVVPGRVEATSEPSVLETVAGPDSTRLVLAAGAASSFRMEWRRRKALGQEEVFLAAEHRLSFVPRRASPVFEWTARITAARRKTDRLVFREPPGARVLAVSGPLVHSWERGAEGLAVTLAEEVVGEVAISFSGLLEPPSSRYVLGPPSLTGSFSDTGFLALWEPGGSELAVESVEGAREAAPGEAGDLPVLEPSEAAGVRPRLSRVFAFVSPEARVTVVEGPRGLRSEVHGTVLATATESRAILEGAVRIDVRRGRLERVSIFVPAPWGIVEASEVAGGGRSLHGILREARETEAGTRLDLVLQRAAPSGDHLDIRIALEQGGFDDVRSWERREIEIALPRVEGAERTRWDLGIAIPPSMDAILGDMPGWRSLDPEEMERLGLARARPEGSVRLAAGLVSREPEARLSFALLKRPPRGEFRAVTHLLALERLARARTDIQVTIVDRPIESLAFQLPASAAASAIILGPGIKESESAGDRRVVRFARPWVGTRQYRVEFETELRPEAEAPFPDVRVEPEGGKGFIGGERFLVLQSQGPVEIVPRLGEGLSAVDAGDLPDFGEPWPVGRVLTAYRFGARGSPGAFRTLVHERAPVLGRLARTLALSTVLGADGTSRTRAEILLAYSRDQDFAVELPADARCLAVTVNGEPVRAVIAAALRVPERAGPGRAPARNAFRIPLPPQSYATVTITYERPGPSLSPAKGTPRALGSWGTWAESAPRLPEIPVGETRWVVQHPEGYRVYLRGGDLRASDPHAEERDATFAESFFGRILSGRLPVFTTFLPEGPRAPSPDVPELTPEEARGALVAGSESATARGPLKPKAPEAGGAPRGAAPLFRLRPEGRPIEATKLGGDAEIRLFYAADSWWRFSKKTVFSSAIILGAFLFARPSRRGFARFVLGGLFFGTLVPLVLGWRSPLLLVPFSEALAVLLVFWGAAALLEKAVSLVRKRRAPVTAAGALLAALAFSALEAAEEPPGARARIPDDGVLIPYDPEALPGGFGVPEKVYVPYRKFFELWRLAHPEERRPEEPPADVVFGNARYALRLQGEAARLLGTVDIQVLTDRWTKIPLPFDRAQLASVRIDGHEAGVGQTPSPERSASVPFVELRGAGRRRLEVELLAPVRRDPGEFRVLAGLLAGSATTLRAELPLGARVEARRAAAPGDPAPVPIVTSEEDGLTIAVVDLGGADRIEIAWSFPKIEGETGSQVDSVSYSRLDLGRDGYSVVRLERVRVTGRKVDSLQYEVHGGWRLTDVAGADVAEWSVLRDAADPPRERLQVFFAKPVDSALLTIRGRALLEASGPLATLSLLGAVKQETYVGLRHFADRRFAADVLRGGIVDGRTIAGMERASRQDLLRAFAVPEAELPDRIYQTYGSGAGLTLAAEPVSSEAAIDTDFVFVLLADRLVVSARSRTSVTGPGPLRHEVPIPPEWSVRSVRSPSLRDWEVAREGGSARLVVSFAGRVPSGEEVVWSAERLFPAGPPERLEVPALAARAPGASAVRESQRWAFAASDEFDLSVIEAGRLVPASLDAVPRWIEIPGAASYRFGLRTPRTAAAEEGTPAVLGAARRPSRLAAVVVAFVRVAEDSVQTNVRAIFRVRGAGRDRFRLALPPGAELVSLECLNERSRTVREGDAGTEVEIVLRSPAVGEHAVDVAFRVRREPGSVPAVSPVRLFDGDDRLEDVDHYVGVLQTAAATLNATSTRGLVRAEPETLPYLPQGISAASLRPTFRATQADWSLVIAEEEIEVAPGPAAIVELAELMTVVGRDGVARTRVAYTLRNRALQFLIVELPEGADLWGVTLDGSPVAVGEAGEAGESARPGAAPPRGGGRVLRIPVERVGEAGLSLEIVLQYEERRLGLPALRGRERLRAPRVRGTEVVETIWNLHFPEEYWVRMSGGNLREVAPSAHFATKLGNLLEQYQRVVRSAPEADSPRQRERRARDLARLERVLGDNLTQLELASRGAADAAQSGRLGAQVLEEQWVRNDALAARSEEALREARKKREEEAQAAAPIGKGEQAFLEAGNFLKQTWRGGKEAKRVEAPAEAPRPGGPPLDALLEESPFQGLKGLALSGVTDEAEVAEPQPIDGTAGLKPLPESLIGAAAPGMESAPSAAGCRPYAFLRAGGDAELAVSFVRRDAGGRLAALVLLLGVPAACWLSRRRGRRA